MFDWLRFLSLAERLATNADEESLRSAISRAYYAAFHVAYVYVLTVDRYPGRKRLRHVEVWDAFVDAPAFVGGPIDVRGIRLMHDRHSADYAARFPGRLPEKTNEAIRDARAIVDAVGRLSGSLGA